MVVKTIIRAAVCAQLSAVQQRADQAARELQEAHIARMAAEHRAADSQMRHNPASTSATQQVPRLLLMLEAKRGSCTLIDSNS